MPGQPSPNERAAAASGCRPAGAEAVRQATVEAMAALTRLELEARRAGVGLPPAFEDLLHGRRAPGQLDADEEPSGHPSCPARSRVRRRSPEDSLATAPKRPRPAEGPFLSSCDRGRGTTPTTSRDTLVVTARIGVADVKRLMVDTGSACDILFLSTVRSMNLLDLAMEAPAALLPGFTGASTPVLGVVNLPVSFGSEPFVLTRMNKFIVVDARTAYNGIFGRPYLEATGAVLSMACSRIRFRTPNGVGEVTGCPPQARECYQTIARSRDSSPALAVDVYDGRDGRESHGATIEDVDRIALAGGPDRTVAVGSELPPILREDIVGFLRTQSDMFAWSPADMPGVDPSIICHKLNVDPMAKPVRQKQRGSGGEKKRAAAEEVDRLLKAGFIREVQYPEWLANVVVVPKANKKWRMCVDFTSLNKHCPKDSYPLPRIDHLVDQASGYGLLSFLDAFSGYNQISMAPEDEEKTAFITDRGTFCYTKMPFGLKNAGATYQRMVAKVFQDQIGRNVEVYIDDMLVKTQRPDDHLRDLRETFGRLRLHNIRLNPDKCIFGV